MLVPVAFLALGAMLCVAAVLEGGIAFERISVKHAAANYAEVALSQARASLVTGLAAQLRGGAAALSAPEPMTVAAGPFSVTAAFALGAAGGNPNAVANALQNHPAIAERRLAARIVETVRDKAGAVVATRAQNVTLRGFGVEPYIAIDGTGDDSASRDVASEADAGGCDPSTPGACDANNPSANASPSDTRIHALVQCVGDGCASQYSNVDRLSASAWSNPNALTNGWSR
jgi:hypothetical protein